MISKMCLLTLGVSSVLAVSANVKAALAQAADAMLGVSVADHINELKSEVAIRSMSQSTPTRGTRS